MAATCTCLEDISLASKTSLSSSDATMKRNIGSQSPQALSLTIPSLADTLVRLALIIACADRALSDHRQCLSCKCLTDLYHQAGLALPQVLCLKSRPTHFAGSCAVCPAGVVCGSSFCAIGSKSSVESAEQIERGHDTTQGVAPGEPVLHRYSFSDQLWDCVKVPGPACGHGSLLAAHGKSLIVYGKLLAISSYQHVLICSSHHPAWLCL